MIELQIIKNSIRRKLYDYKTLIMISVFPLVLTTIFVNVFNKVETRSVGEVSLILQSESQEIGEAYRGMIEAVNELGTIKIECETIDNEEEGKVLLKEKADFLVRIKDNPLQIEVIKGKGSNIENLQIQQLSKGFVRQVLLNEIGHGEVQTTPVLWEYQKIPSQEAASITIGMALTMITFGALLGGQYGINQMFYIREAIGKRVLTAPVRESRLYTCEIISSSIILFSSTIILTGIYNVLFKLGLEKNIGATIVIIGGLTIMAITIGVIIGVLVPSLTAGESILSILVIVLNFTSGGFTPGVDLGIVGELSPIKGIIDILTGISTTGEARGIGIVMITIVSICIGLLVIGNIALKVKGGAKYAKHIKVSKTSY